MVYTPNCQICSISSQPLFHFYMKSESHFSKAIFVCKATLSFKFRWQYGEPICRVILMGAALLLACIKT